MRPERDSIGAQYPVEVDTCRGTHQGRWARDPSKAVVVGAVGVRPRALDADGKKRSEDLYAWRLRLRFAPNRSAKTRTGFVQENWAKGNTCFTSFQRNRALLNFEWVEWGEMFVKKAVTQPANSRRDLFWAAQISEATIVGFS